MPNMKPTTMIAKHIQNALAARKNGDSLPGLIAGKLDEPLTADQITEVFSVLEREKVEIATGTLHGLSAAMRLGAEYKDFRERAGSEAKARNVTVSKVLGTAHKAIALNGATAESALSAARDTIEGVSDSDAAEIAVARAVTNCAAYIAGLQGDLNLPDDDAQALSELLDTANNLIESRAWKAKPAKSLG